MPEKTKFMSSIMYKMLLEKLREFQEESGVIITEFSITFPYHGGPGLPVNITMKVEMMD